MRLLEVQKGLKAPPSPFPISWPKGALNPPVDLWVTVFFIILDLVCKDIPIYLVILAPFSMARSSFRCSCTSGHL